MLPKRLYVVMQHDDIYQDRDAARGEDEQIVYLSYEAAFRRLQCLAQAGTEGLHIWEYVPW